MVVLSTTDSVPCLPRPPPCVVPCHPCCSPRRCGIVSPLLNNNTSLSFCRASVALNCHWSISSFGRASSGFSPVASIFSQRLAVAVAQATKQVGLDMRNSYPHGCCLPRSATPTEMCPLVTLRVPLRQEMGSSPRNDQEGGRSHELKRAGKVGNNGCSWRLWGGVQ